MTSFTMWPLILNTDWDKLNKTKLKKSLTGEKLMSVGGAVVCCNAKEQ